MNQLHLKGSNKMLYDPEDQELTDEEISDFEDDLSDAEISEIYGWPYP